MNVIDKKIAPCGEYSRDVKLLVIRPGNRNAGAKASDIRAKCSESFGSGFGKSGANSVSPHLDHVVPIDLVDGYTNTETKVIVKL